jgi:hypothetical protein
MACKALTGFEIRKKVGSVLDFVSPMANFGLDYMLLYRQE